MMQGYRGYGVVPNDDLSSSADQLIVAVDQGQTTQAQSLISSTPGICQRALDILNLPACAAGQTPDGTCVQASALTQGVSADISQLQSLCASGGQSVSTGLSTPAKIAIAGGVIIAIALAVRYARKG